MRWRRRKKPTSAGAIEAEQLVWIFGYGRSGTSWLARMLSHPPGYSHWNEPQVGQMVGNFYYEVFPHRRNASFLLGDRHRDVWEDGIRSLVLDGAQARYAGSRFVIIKEPHGSIGAPLLSGALPESRVIVLLRDPRDVIASVLAGGRSGAWRNDLVRRQDQNARIADTNPDRFVATASRALVANVTRAYEAHETHPGPRSLLTYEELRAHPEPTLGRVLGELRLPAGPEALHEAVEHHRWERIPAAETGPTKPRRKAQPGTWSEDLTERQVAIVEEIAGPALELHRSITQRVVAAGPGPEA